MPVLTKINTNSIADDAVTAAKIPTDAIGATDIAANAVGTSEIATGNDADGSLEIFGSHPVNTSGGTYVETQLPISEIRCGCKEVLMPLVGCKVNYIVQADDTIGISCLESNINGLNNINERNT